MSFFKNYIAYIKNNPNHYWFKRKLYGLGWTPATWQGWLVILAFVIFVVFQTVLLNFTGQTATDTVLFLANVALGIIALLLVCKIKGEKLKWQWGISKRKDKD